MNLSDLPTPAALVDEAKLARNLTRMQAQVAGLGARFRPHVKTTKCLEIVRRQIAAGAQGITVSTLKEAEQFFAAGIDDILYAVCIAPNRLDQAAALRQRGCRLTILVDSMDAAERVVAHGRAHGHKHDVMIEVDTDGHRAGVGPEDEQLLAIGRALAHSAKLAGVLTHAGSSYELDTPDALAALAEQERALCVRAAERLRAAGLPCPEVRIGSTPTALAARNLAGVTEVRAGVYAFFDLVMANVGVCTPEDIALSVLTTVIGHQHDKGWVMVDAGWMAMSRDRGTAKQKHDYGYGAVCDAAGRRLPGLVVSGANQEHGIVSNADGSAAAGIAERFPIGSQLRILPNHACATGAQFGAYHAIGAGGAAQTWERFGGW